MHTHTRKHTHTHTHTRQGRQQQTCCVATRSSRFASSTSITSTLSDRRILACASDSRTIDSSCRGVAEMVFLLVLMRRMLTYPSISAALASSVSCGWHSLRANDTYSANSSMLSTVSLLCGGCS